MGTTSRTMPKQVFSIVAVLSLILAAVFATLTVAPATSEAQPGSGLIFATVATCIESDTVQGDPAAASMSVGNVYEGTDGTRHLIVTGAPSCKFNCRMSLDLNCDGHLGDYCDAKYNLQSVAGVKACLASMVPAEAPAAVESVPAVPVVSVGVLAHTGAETDALAYLGAGFLSAGAFVLGLRRRLQD